MASAAEPEYVRCAACGDSATTPRAFLLDCCACDKSYHHTCATPPLTEDALLERATATRQKKATGTIHDWRCHNCLTRQQLEQLERERQDDVIVISSDESDREKTPIPPPPPTPAWKKSVLDLLPANRPAAPRLSNQGASSLRVGLDHVATTRSAAAQRARAVNSLDPSLPPLEPPCRPKVASTSVPVLPSNLQHSITASTANKMVKTPLFPPPSRTPSQTLPDIDCPKLRKRPRSASGGKERPSKRVKREGHQSSGSLFERYHHVEANNKPPQKPSPGPRQPLPMALDDNRNPDPPASREPPPAVDVFGMPPEMMMLPGDEPKPPPPPPPDSEEDNKPAAFMHEPSTQAVQRPLTPQPNGKGAVPAAVDVVELTPGSSDKDAPPPQEKPPAASAIKLPRVTNPTPPASKSAPPPDDHEKISKDALPAHPPHVAKVVPAKRQLSPGQADGQTIGKQMRTDASKLPAQTPARWKDDAVWQDAGPNPADAGPSTSMQPPHVPQSCRRPAHPPPASQHTRTPTAPAHAYERLVSLPPIACLQSDDEHSGASTPAPISQPTPHAFSDYDELDDDGEGAEEEESQDGRAQRGMVQEHIRGFQRRRGMDAAKGLPAPAPPLPTPAPPSSQPAGPRLHGERRGPAPHVPRTSSPSPALSKAALWGTAASPQSPSKEVLLSAAATSNHATATATSSHTAAAFNHALHRAPAPPTYKKPKVSAAARAPAKDTPAPPPAGFAVPWPVGERRSPPAAAPPPPPPKDAADDAPDEAKAAHELMYARFILNQYDGVGPPPHDARLWRRVRRTIATRTDAVRVVEAWERAQAGPSAEAPFAQLEPGQEEQDVQQAKEEEREEARPPADESDVETSVQEEREMSMPRPRLPLLATTSLRRQLSTPELGTTSSSGEVSDSMQADGGAVIRVGSVVCTKARQRQTARKTVAKWSVASGDAGSSAGPSKLAKASVDVEVSEAGPSNASSKKSNARAISSGQSKSLRSITVSGLAPGLAPHPHPLARTTSNASAGAVDPPARPVLLDDVVARLTARRVANPAPPVGSTPVKGRGRARRAALERRLLDGKVLSDAHADTRRKRREVMRAVKESGSLACESSRLVIQRAPKDALDRAR